MKARVDKLFGLGKKSPKKEKAVKDPEIKEDHSAKTAKSPKVNSVNKHTMKEIKDFNPGKLPAEEMRQFRKEVNQLIAQFNHSHQNDQKMQFLQEIQDKITAVDYKYPPTLLESSNGYRAVHARLFQEIKKQMAQMGNKSLLPPQAKASPLAEVIANMSPEKTEQLMAILIKGKNSSLGMELDELYGRKDSSAEAELFRDFLKNHEIRFLGGGNSKNFAVTNLTNNSTQVLKVDCRLDMPRNVEAHLREKLSSQFAPNDAERQVTFENDNNETLSRTLLVTEYCTGGSVAECGEQAKKTGQAENIAVDIFEQMADVMSQIQKQGCMFPDAKLTNWLVNEEGKLILADTKSFVFVNDNGRYSPDLPGNEYVGLLRTGCFVPPEFDTNQMYADKVHAYLLGKNLYIFLTGKYESGHDGNKFDFSNPVFKTDTGQELKELIKGLVQPASYARMPVSKARDKLFSIMKNNLFNELEGLKFGSHVKTVDEFIADKKQQLDAAKNNPEERARIIAEIKPVIAQFVTDLKAERVMELEADSAANKMKPEIFNDLEKLKFGPDDKMMNEFIADKKQQLEAVKDNPGESAKIITELKSTVAALKADKAANEVRNIIDNFRKNAGVFSMGMEAKADKIERAMINVPIADRAKLVDASSSKEVMAALATHRYLGKRGDVYYKAGSTELDADKAASTYKNFKERFIDQKEKMKADSQEPSNAAEETEGMKFK